MNWAMFICRKCILGGLSVVKKFIVVGAIFLLLCEYAVYPIVLSQCSWPEANKASMENETLRAMFLADTHLLGPFRGHWFDKLRREWQMYRSFQTVMGLFQPEAVFFLGDVFDEGNWVNEDGFDNYVNRFHELFSVKSNGKTRSFILTGNHDMGFHYEIVPKLHRRFNNAFNTTSVRLLKLKGSKFLLLNSMAMEMDGCFLCASAVQSLRKISKKLACEEHPETETCTSVASQQNVAAAYSPPILLQHFPMYRESDEACTGEDTAPDEEKIEKFREAIDCLSKEASQFLFKAIRPRLILSGHTHHHCVAEHALRNASSRSSVLEYSIPSFSWRNRNDPSFYLAIITPSDYQLAKCYLPKESTVYYLYILGSFAFLVWLLLPIFKSLRIGKSSCSLSVSDSITKPEERRQ